MSTYSLTIVTPAGTVFDGAVESLVAPGEEGMLGVLSHHAPMVAGLRPGVLSVTPEARSVLYFAVGVGVLEVSAANEVVVLADSADPAGTREEAERRLEKAAVSG